MFVFCSCLPTSVGEREAAVPLRELFRSKFVSATQVYPESNVQSASKANFIVAAGDIPSPVEAALRSWTVLSPDGFSSRLCVSSAPHETAVPGPRSRENEGSVVLPLANSTTTYKAAWQQAGASAVEWTPTSAS